MKVICAGLPKTGTKTICSALRILGLKVYDFEEQLWYLRKDLLKALDVGCTTEEYRKMFEGVDAVTDFPACMLWEDISKAFPEAKILYCERRDEHEWLNSFKSQINVVRNNRILQILLLLTYTGLQVQKYGNAATRVGFGWAPSWPWKRAPVNEKVAIMRYREHNSHVLRSAPKDKLLVFKLSDGWKPLCEFLNVPKPKQEFPHRNKGGVIADEIMENSLVFKRIKKELLVSLSAIIAGFAYFAYVIVTML